MIVLVIGLVLSSAFMFYILMVILFQMYKKNRHTPHLLIGLTFSLTAILFAIADIILQFTYYYSISIFFIKAILVSIAYYFLYRHYEGLLTSSPAFLRHLVIYTLTTTSVVLYILKLMKIIPDFITIPFITLDSIEAFLGIIVFSFTSYAMIVTHKQIRSKSTFTELIAQVILLLANIFWWSAEMVWSIYQMELARLYTILILTGSGLIFIGIGILLINYFVNLEHMYHVPTLIHSVLIINAGGTPIYNRKIYPVPNPRGKEFNEFLFSGAVFSLHILIEEVFGDRDTFRSMSFGRYKIFFSELKEENIMVLLTSGTNYFLKQSSKKFKEIFLKATLPDATTSINPRQYAEIIDPLIRKAFPYLILEQK